jgi:dipeptidase E
MVNAVLYSDQIIPANARIDALLLEMIERRGNRIGYVPSGPDPDGRFFAGRQAYYARYGLRLPIAYDLDRDHSQAELEDLLACAAIHLSGGNTAAFLGRMKCSGMLAILRRWAEAGGPLIGTSAGAILMTPTIAVDALFTDGDPAEAKKATALDLVPFEFFPHLQARPSHLPDLLRYSTRTPRPIIACADGDGVVVSNGIATCVGDPLRLFDGTAERVTEFAVAAKAPAPARRGRSRSSAGSAPGRRGPS